MIPPKPPRGVDCHAHVFSAGAPAVDGARYRPAYQATLAEWRSHRPGAGITHGVLVQPSFFGNDNSELLAALATDPQHLRGVAVTSPMVDDETLRRMHAAGVRAIRFNLRGLTDFHEYASDSWLELLVRAYALGWHLEVSVDPGGVRAVAPLLEETPIDVVFDHFAMPGTDEGAIGGDPLEFARRWVEIVGPGRVVWGSDWPWTRHEDAGDYARLRKALDRWVGAEQVAAVLWDNAARLYDFARDASA